MGFQLGSAIMTKLEMLTTSDHASIVSMNIFVALLCTCIVIGHLLEEYRWMNESITALLIGLATGVVILLTSRGKSSHILVFSEDLFFIYLLPPIIFNAGFQVKKKQFFRNFITIMLFGAVGTLISCAVISLGGLNGGESEKLFDRVNWVNCHFLDLSMMDQKGFLSEVETLDLRGGWGLFCFFFGLNIMGGVTQIFKKMDIGSLDIGDYLAIGAIFAATDSVCTLQVLNQEETPLLYSLVFGEGVVNDATSVVLFNALQGFDLESINPSIALHFAGNFFYLFITSTMLGVLSGLLTAYVIKKLYFGRHSTDREVALMILMAYLSYMMAELFYLSGILTVFFCGIVMSHYTWHNVTESSRITTKHAFATLSFVAETFIFLYVGMDALDIEKWRFASTSPGTSIAVSAILVGLVLVGRAAFVFPLSFLSNLAKKSPIEKISFKQQIVIWWAGLMRGAVSMALAYNKFTRAGHTQLLGNAIMITSTITVVLFSTVVFGLLTQPIIRFLLPPQRLSSAASSEHTSPKSVTVPLLGQQHDSEGDLGSREISNPPSLRLLLTTPTHTVHRYWRKFDDSFMRPVFGGRGFVPFVRGSPTERSPR